MMSLAPVNLLTFLKKILIKIDCCIVFSVFICRGLDEQIYPSRSGRIDLDGLGLEV